MQFPASVTHLDRPTMKLATRRLSLCNSEVHSASALLPCSHLAVINGRTAWLSGNRFEAYSSSSAFFVCCWAGFYDGGGRMSRGYFRLLAQSRFGSVGIAALTWKSTSGALESSNSVRSVYARTRPFFLQNWFLKQNFYLRA